MEKYIKPKTEFAEGIAFHDSKIKSMKTVGKTLVMELENYHIIEKNGSYTDNCKVTFHDFDEDEFVSEFRVLSNKKYKDYRFSKLLKWLKKGKIKNPEIIHTYYNFSVILFCGVYYVDGKCKNFELRISYGGDMAVEYELDRK